MEVLKQLYFTASSILICGKPYILRLVVQRDATDALIDHYFEYGSPLSDSPTLDDSLWSADPDALIDQMPGADRFHASMDLRQFIRTDLDDALDGTLMAEDYEMVLRQDRPDEALATA